MDNEKTHLYKMTITGTKADDAMDSILTGVMVSVGRISPIVVYVEMTQTQANYIDEKYPLSIEVTRAPINWRI